MSNAIREWYGGGYYPEWGETAEDAAQATNAAASMRGATAGTPATTAAGGSDDPISRAAAIGKKGNPIVAFFVALFIFCAVWYGITKLEGDEGRRTIPFTATNMFLVTVQAALGIFVMKNVFTKWAVPGWTTVTHQI